MKEDEDAKYGALAALIAFGIIVVMVAVLAWIVGAWA